MLTQPERIDTCPIALDHVRSLTPPAKVFKHDRSACPKLGHCQNFWRDIFAVDFKRAWWPPIPLVPGPLEGPFFREGPIILAVKFRLRHGDSGITH